MDVGFSRHCREFIGQACWTIRRIKLAPRGMQAPRITLATWLAGIDRVMPTPPLRVTWLTRNEAYSKVRVTTCATAWPFALV